MRENATDAAELQTFRAKVSAMEAAIADVVLGASRLVESGAAERVEGRPLDLLLAADVGMPGVDRYHLLNAADVLGSLPRIAELWAGGCLSWGQVRAICAAVRRRSAEERAIVDARVAACLAGRPAVEGSAVRLDHHDPDALLAGVERLLEELRHRRAVERDEARARRQRFLSLQPRLDGGVDGRFCYADPEAAALVTEAIAAHGEQPLADDPARPPEQATGEQRSQAEALLSLCRAGLAGRRGDGASVPARPSIVVDVDVEDLEANAVGMVRLRLRGQPRRLTGAALGRLADTGADVRVVLTRDGQPLAVTGPARTDDLAQAVTARTAAVLPDHAERDGEDGGHAARGPHGGGRDGDGDRGDDLDGDRRDDGGGDRDRGGDEVSGLARLLATIEAALGASAVTGRVLAGERPLVDAALLHAATIPTLVRIAVTARDKGCRFLGCDAPAAWSEAHHIRWRRHGGLHHVDNLVLLCRRCHRLVHRHDWQLTLKPDGTLTGRRGRRMWTTRPKGTGLPRAGPDPPPIPAEPSPTRPPINDPPPHPDSPF